MPDKPIMVGLDRQRFKRSRLTKSYSYRYEVGRSVGPPGEPLVEAGCSIVSSRYCGRTASWNVSRSVMSTEHYVVNASFVAPSPENPMTYPPRPPRKLKPEVATRPGSVPVPRVPVVPRLLPPPPDKEPEKEVALWNDRPRRADPAPPPEKPRPQPGAHMHEPPPRFPR